MKYPALDVAGADHDLLLASVDGLGATAIDDSSPTLTIFFSDPASRDRAQAEILRAFPRAAATAREVDDENWAARSQASLQSIAVGRLIVAPPWDAPEPEADQVVIVILPSMGFGTGHHATTRLCLAALQSIDLQGKRVLDVGTGSGVLAIAARRLGAEGAMGLDSDADAVQSAEENLALNPSVDAVHFEQRDLRAAPLPRADVVLANLTGALLVQSAPLLLDAVRGDGTLVVSGIEAHERDAVVAAFAGARLVWEAEEDRWVGLRFNRGATIAV